MKTIIITFNDLSEEKKSILYHKMSREVILELKENLSISEYKKITFGQIDKIVEERLRECTYEFIFDATIL